MKPILKKRHVLFPLIILITTSCVNLSRRFKNHDFVWVNKKDLKKYVNIQTESYNIIEDSKPSTSSKDVSNFVRELSPEGQAEIFKALSSKSTSIDQFATSLTHKLVINNSSPSKIRVFPTTINKSIVFSVDRRWVSEGGNEDYRTFNRIADRLTNLEVSLDLPDSGNIEFNSWDKFVTDWVTVDLGKVTSSQQWSATANVSASTSAKTYGSNKSTLSNTIATKSGKSDIGLTENSDLNNSGGEILKGNEHSTSIGPSASLNLTDKYETNINLLLSRMKLSGTISKSSIVLRQEGAFGVDLSGNTSVSVQYNFNGDYADPITIFKVPDYYKATEAIPVASLLKNTAKWFFPNITEPVPGYLKYKYLYRHVNKNTVKHIPEARQSVTFFYGEIGQTSEIPPLKIDLIKPEDFKPITYRIGLETGGTIQYLKWDDEIINFETASEAASFVEYLINLSKTNNTYGTIKPAPTATQINNIKVKKYQN
ncbi:hypothetical protein [Rufibacter quisquiliarum]|uniref:Lipoprotein n=1 Tax=Rufibacter quisquiliarum TaxID=1549639 RepID=A0A839GV98_9BACT|nr:hypothetical protein [Rufibacter quisquiliarum]MBA9078787.1 hypothetical protein [Rufibacter quisquiliarum]